ncbi:hypothetical protein THAOC_10527, partial [Thalassiosira oceanica]
MDNSRVSSSSGSGDVLARLVRATVRRKLAADPESVPFTALSLNGTSFVRNSTLTVVGRIPDDEISDLPYIPTPSISVPQEMKLPIKKKTVKANSTPWANLLAGLEAADHPGQYVAAAEYLALGRKQIGPSGWETDRQLTRQLFSEGASLAFRTGDANTMNALLDEVLSRPDLTVMEKFRAYEIKIIARQSTDQFHEALTLGLDVLKQLGLPVLIDKPRSKVSIVIEYIKTKRALGKRTAEELASLPRLTDERIGMGLRISELLLSSCYQAQPT